MTMNTPEVCKAGIEVRGEVKTIYNVLSMSRDVQMKLTDPPVAGDILLQAHTACKRTISILKQGEESPNYEVNVSLPCSDEIERSYRGGEGSDAHRVYVGYEGAWNTRFSPLARVKEYA
jgi:hypothetical protein